MILWNRILVGVDDGEASLGAVRYLAAVLGGSNTSKVRLLAVYKPPDPDLEPDPAALAAQAAERRLALEARLAEAYHILVEARLAQENLSTDLVETQGRSIGETIMAEQAAGGYGTVVVGRRGMTKAEEFLFGSVSSNVVHQATDCCVWVVA
ncbi:MAG: universal stress protein [Desulfarculus sp.]|nr:universal stress protein [Desulfarculus sp.]